VALFVYDGLTQAELASGLELEQPTVSNTLKRMHRDGLIQRATNPSDRREVHLHLTERARALIPQLLTMAAEVDSAAVAGLSSDEAQTLHELLQRFTDNLSADTTTS
jgi:DNA-binding MarR family transcriptional regulator